MPLSFFVGLESRLLATVRWTVATGVAFPQKGDSNRRIIPRTGAFTFFCYYSLILFFGICGFPIFLFRRNLKISSNCLFTNRKLSAIIFNVLNMARWCSRLARQPVTLEVDGSSPFRVAKKEATPKGWLPFWQFEKRTRKTNPTPRWGVDRRVGARRYHTIPERESATSPFRVTEKTGGSLKDADALSGNKFSLGEHSAAMQ